MVNEVLLASGQSGTLDAVADKQNQHTLVGGQLEGRRREEHGGEV